MRDLNIRGKIVQATGFSKCKSPEVRAWLAVGGTQGGRGSGPGEMKGGEAGPVGACRAF